MSGKRRTNGKRGNGEASIYRRQDGYWVGAVSDTPGHRQVIYGKTRGEVAEKVTVVLRSVRRGRTITTRRQTVGAYLEKWIAGAEASVRGTTFRRYSQLVRVHLIPRLGAVQLAKLSPADCGKAYAAMVNEGLAPRTAGHAHRVLGRALREAEGEGLIDRNVTRLVRPPHVPHAEMQTLSAEQSRQLIAASASDRLGVLYHVALASGARQGELLGLRWSDVASGAIRIQRTLRRTHRGLEMGETKTPSSRRTVPIGTAATSALRRHRAAQEMERRVAGAAWHDEDLVFSDEVGAYLDGVKITRAFYVVLARAGLPRIRFHDLRHTCATLLLEAGVHPRVVAERLGHTTPSLVLNTYGHVTERMQEQATAAIDRALGS